MSRNTAISEGEAKIIVSCGGESAFCWIYVQKADDPVSDIPVSSVWIEYTSLEMNKGDSRILRAVVYPADATDKTITWSSSAPSIVSVDQGGQLTALSAGKSVITASAGGKSATCTVNVSVPVSSVVLDRNSITLEEGQSTRLTATVLPEDATNKTLVWSIMNSSVATIDQNGVVTGLQVGSTTVVVNCGNEFAYCSVRVTEKGTDTGDPEELEDQGEEDW